MLKITVLLPMLLTVVGVQTVEAGETPDTSTKAEKQSNDWPWWRGPHRNGIADSSQVIPLSWSAENNILWKTPIPGRGHGSPTVYQNQIFLATADESAQTQSVLCLDRKTGETLWTTKIHEGGFATKGNKKASQASSSVACDGERLFINFVNNKAMFTTALDLNGKQLWQTKITDYVIHQGFGSSPAIYGDLVIVSADNKVGGAIAGLKRDSGDVVWKVDRPETPNYASPIILNVAGKDQLILTGCNLVSSYDPLKGTKNWEVKGSTTECVTSTVTDGKRVYTSGGYPKNHISAVEADGSGKVAWENSVRVYVPSMLVTDGYLYGVTDAGVAYCWDAATGEEQWKGRLGGTFSSSLVLVKDKLLATNESGVTSIFMANPNDFVQKVGDNKLGDETYSTPSVCGGRIYHRAAVREKSKRQEYLYCIAGTQSPGE